VRAIRVSDEVWAEIERHRRFGETDDDVVKWAFKIAEIAKKAAPSTPIPPSSKSAGRRGHFARIRMHAGVDDKQLVVSFANGVQRRFDLPDQKDKERLRRVRSDAVNFAVQNGATQGQRYAVMKALTEAGYHLTK
jgi:hypothetical protein